jgi:AAA family ATP:ADP antiporter
MGKLLQFFQYICRFNFGDFEKEEFKKFLRMGLIFSLIIGVYWTLRPLKDAIFISFVDKLQLPYAKTISVIALLFFVMFYTKLIERHSKEKMLKLLPTFYGICILIFSGIIFFMQGTHEEVATRTGFYWFLSKCLGYIWYLFVESFGSLVVALFWAFSSDSTEPTSAKRGFPLVYLFGQLGGILFPYTIGGLPHRLHFTTDALALFILGCLTLIIVPLVNYLMKATPYNLMVAFHGKNEAEVKKEEPGFFEGLKLLVKHKYLLGIFCVNFIYEIIVTIFDFNFKVAAADQYSGVALSSYLSLFASSVNIVSASCLILGISNITRFLGIPVALAAMPIIMGSALFGFISYNHLTFLFVLMVGSKAINYALMGPALKQLYIPTTVDVRFKAQAWIETFGSRSSKEVGSIFNMMLAPLQKSFGALVGKSYYLIASASVCFPLVAFWFFIALFLGKKFKKAVNNKEIIC